MKNLGKLNKQSVRSSEPNAAPGELSLQRLRQVTGGVNAYVHTDVGGSCQQVK